MLEQQTTIRPTTDDGANYFSSICSFMVGQMPEAAATINSATVILTRTPLMPEPKPTTTRREQTRERERSCFRSFYHQERRRRKARGKEILKNACLIFTSNSWNFKLVSRKYHVTLSNQGLVLENCMNKKPKKKKKSQSKYSNKKYWASRYHKCFSFCSVCSLYQVHLPLLPVAL